MPVSCTHVTALLSVEMYYTTAEHDLCTTCYERPPVLRDRFLLGRRSGRPRQVLLYTLPIGFTATSYAVLRGRPAPLVAEKFLAGGLRVYFCLDSCLVYIHFAHTQDHDYVLYLCGVPLTLCGWLVLVSYHPKKWKKKNNLVECVQL